MESNDKDQGEIKIKPDPTGEACVSLSGSGIGLCLSRACIDRLCEVFVDATEQRMGNQKREEVRNVVTEAGILRI